MKLLWVSQKFPPDMGGVQQYVYNYVENLPQSSCIVLTRNSNNTFAVDQRLSNKQQVVYRKSIFPDDLGIYSALKNPGLFFQFCMAIYSYARKERVTHIIFGHPSLYYFFAMIFLKIGLRLPFICIFHGEDIPIIKIKSTPLFLWLVNRLNGYICNSLFTYNQLKFFLKRDIPENIAFPGVEEKFFNCICTSEDCKQKFGLSGKTVLYTVGRLDERKGHDLVIQSLPSIIKDRPDVIYAIGGTGPQMPNLKSLVEELQLGNYVKFYGFIKENDIVEFHKAGDVFVMPNRILADGDTEGFGIVFLEAGAVGNPVIGGKTGGVVEAVEDGITGFLVNPYATDEFIEKTLFLLKEQNKAELMGMMGKNRAKQNFCWATLASQFASLLSWS